MCFSVVKISEYTTPMGYGSKRRKLNPKPAISKLSKIVRTLDIDNPPKLDLSYPRKTQVFRFVCTTAKNEYLVTRANLLSMLVIGNTAGLVTQNRIMQSIRFVRCRAWSPPASAGSSASDLTLEMFGTTLGSRVIDDTNVANTASYVSISPKKGTSDASFWILQGVSESTGVFLITCPVGTCIDIHVECTTASNTTTASSTVTTSANLAQGVISYNALDQTTNQLRPVTGVNSIA